MARFYDTTSDTEAGRIARLLKDGGIVFSLGVVKDTSTVINEIQVAEEDFAEAERILSGATNAIH